MKDMWEKKPEGLKWKMGEQGKILDEVRDLVIEVQEMEADVEVFSGGKEYSMERK